MKASEIIRKIADIIDAQEVNRSSSTEITNRPGQVGVDVPCDTQDIEGQAEVNVKTMVPPLQQKLELMKTLAGVDGAEGEEPRDELDIIKQNAGIKVAAIEVGNDTDIEN